MWEATKEWLRWAWNWVTVLTATIAGSLVFITPILDVFVSNLLPVMKPETGMMVTAGVGIVKGLVALVQSQTGADAD